MFEEDPVLQAVVRYCRLYRQKLNQHPDWAAWLQDPGVREPPYGPGMLQREWAALYPGGERDLAVLRRFRQRMSMRLALREINELAPLEVTLREQSDLAEFCLQRVFDWVLDHWTQRLGQPWHEAAGQPAAFSVLGFGKLGGRELNFCSDVDLVFLYSGDGACRRGDGSEGMRNREFFTRVCQEAIREIQVRTADGFLYNVDVRLRPQANNGPLLLPLSAMVQYYTASGQTWERLALLKARPVAGCRSLGEECLEMVQAFRYPRHPPDHLPEDVARLKERTESELLPSDEAERNVKTGYGGIREVEFFTQVLQLLHAGHFPFLQTESTREALQQLLRYELIEREDHDALLQAWAFLRRVENRLQMEEERRLHTLPGDPAHRKVLAESLGFADWEAFARVLQGHRQTVRRIYQSVLPEPAARDRYREWFAFLAEGKDPPAVLARLAHWFGEDPEAPERIRRWVRGGSLAPVARQEVQLFLDMTRHFDRAFRPLADPLETLVRLDRFAARYGARKGFLRTCSTNPSLFAVLCHLFDRSRFIHQLLCRHPEIVEELLTLQIKRRKPVEVLLEEMRRGTDGAAFRDWFWLYLKAEQVRIAMNHVLEFYDLETVETELSSLAEAAVRRALEVVDPGGQLAVVGLGKFGAREMTPGSDLDLLLLHAGGDSGPDTERAMELMRLLGHRTPLGPAFVVDLRLRPHGKDGPLLVNPARFRDYHQSSAHPWERLVLTRARPVGGARDLLEAFESVRREILWDSPLTASGLEAIRNVRERMIREKAAVDPPERAFKNGRYGLSDIEYLVQLAQVRLGKEVPSLCDTRTRNALRQLEKHFASSPAPFSGLRQNHGFLRRLEFTLRMESNTAVTVIPEAPEEQVPLARWMGFATAEELLRHLAERFRANREQLGKAFPLLGIPGP